MQTIYNSLLCHVVAVRSEAVCNFMADLLTPSTSLSTGHKLFLLLLKAFEVHYKETPCRSIERLFAMVNAPQTNSVVTDSNIGQV